MDLPFNYIKEHHSILIQALSVYQTYLNSVKVEALKAYAYAEDPPESARELCSFAESKLQEAEYALYKLFSLIEEMGI